MKRTGLKYYIEEKLPEMRKTLPDLRIKEIKQIITNMYRELTPAEKKIYEDKVTAKRSRTEKKVVDKEEKEEGEAETSDKENLVEDQKIEDQNHAEDVPLEDPKIVSEEPQSTLPENDAKPEKNDKLQKKDKKGTSKVHKKHHKPLTFICQLYPVDLEEGKISPIPLEISMKQIQEFMKNWKKTQSSDSDGSSSSSD